MTPSPPARVEAGAVGRVARGVRRAAGWVRRLPDRLLHPIRRRRARRRLGGTWPRGPVLFVCHGNICRSPYAEAVFRRAVDGRIPAESCGLWGPDRPAPATARRVARERGVDLGDHRSRLVSRASLQGAGLVVVMDPGHARALYRRHGYRGALVLGDLDPERVRARAVRDPIFQPPEVFRAVYDRVDRCVEELARLLGADGSAVRAATPRE